MKRSPGSPRHNFYTALLHSISRDRIAFASSDHVGIHLEEHRKGQIEHGHPNIPLRFCAQVQVSSSSDIPFRWLHVVSDIERVPGLPSRAHR